MSLLRTKSSGLYRHREDLGLHKVGYRERNLHIWSLSLPSTPRRVPSGHGWSLRSSYLHSPSVRPMANRPDARGPLNPGLPQALHLEDRTEVLILAVETTWDVVDQGL